jgi:hypothetical protein
MLDLIAAYADYILVVGAIVLDITFLPTLLGPNKPARSTATAFFLVLTAFTVTFFALELFLSSIAQGIGAIMWIITVFQWRATDVRSK